MKCTAHDLEVIGSNPGRVQLCMRNISKNGRDGRVVKMTTCQGIICIVYYLEVMGSNHGCVVLLFKSYLNHKKSIYLRIILPRLYTICNLACDMVKDIFCLHPWLSNKCKSANTVLL